jgi:NTP pyrophosphatase (non-canonical NTP hydrolase)
MKNLTQQIIQFRDERNWKQFHNPKDLAISVNLEASELLEHFQWSDWQSAVEKNREGIADELADVMIYCLMMAHDMGLDPETIIRNKLVKNGEKYPVDKAFGKKDKYDTL